MTSLRLQEPSRKRKDVIVAERSQAARLTHSKYSNVILCGASTRVISAGARAQILRRGSGHKSGLGSAEFAPWTHELCNSHKSQEVLQQLLVTVTSSSSSVLRVLLIALRFLLTPMTGSSPPQCESTDASVFAINTFVIRKYGMV